MSPEGPVTTAELSRRLTALERSVAEGFSALRDDLRTIDYVRKDSFADYRAGMDARMAMLTRAVWWVFALLITALLTGLVTLATGVVAA